MRAAPLYQSAGNLGALQTLRVVLALCALVLAGEKLGAAEVIPPAPKQYFNDYAGVISPDTASRLNEQLEDFERATSSQIVVAIYPKMQTDSPIEDYTVRVAEAWKVGQNERNNGAVLFVFIQDRKMFLQVGYGLEGALPDALAKQIIENELKPRFRNGDFNGGLSAGVAAILAAARGEYKGTGHTVAEQQRGQPRGGEPPVVWLVVGVLAVLFLFVLLRLLARGAASKGTIYHGRGRSPWGGWTSTTGGWMGGSRSHRGWGGGGGSFGGGFSGGGGRFGGGGAGGSW